MDHENASRDGGKVGLSVRLDLPLNSPNKRETPPGEAIFVTGVRFHGESALPSPAMRARGALSIAFARIM